MSAGPTAWLGGALLLFASLYFGLGWGLVLFQFPGALQATRPGGFAERFGRPVRTAVAFFTVWSVLMVVGGIVLTIAEWDQGGYRWGPLVYTVATVVATTFTVVLILPVNRALYADVPDEAQFRSLLRRWINLNIIRTLIWTVEWLAIALWFVALAKDART
jgi:hypothetical protein